MYLYSLKELVLLRKVRFTKASETQDCMFAFSCTGNEIISVDQYGGIHNCISYYSVPTLTLTQRLFEDSDMIEPFAIELQNRENVIYALLQERNQDRIVHKYAVARIADKAVQNKAYITKEEFDIYSGFIELQSKGFSPKAKEWSPLNHRSVDLSNIESCDYSLAHLYESYAKADAGS